MNPTNGAVQGPLQYTTANGSPAWYLEQWQSLNSLYGTTPTLQPSGSWMWATMSKTLAMGPTNSSEADLKLEVNSSAEYGGTYRNPNSPWVALLASQTIFGPGGQFAPGMAGSSIPYLNEADFNLQYNLHYLNNIITTGYDPAIDDIQYSLFFGVQNLNSSSPGYGDYLFFGISVYDAATPITPPKYMFDSGTGKLIYSVGLPFTSAPSQVGQWATISGDILPWVKQAISCAWANGALQGSHNLGDYYISGLNMGFEVPGLADVVMVTKNLSLTLKTRLVGDLGFETPTTPTFTYNPTGTPWTFSSYSGISTNNSLFTMNNPAAPEGGQVAFLQNQGTISQNISGLTVGVNYTIKFNAAQRANYVAQTWNVKIDGTTVGSFAPSASATNYTLYSTTFTATKASQTLSFVGTQLNGGDATVFLDNVQIVPTTPTKVTGLSASGSNGTVNLSWSATPRASSYRLQRATVSGGPYQEVAIPSLTTFSDQIVTKGTTYYYIISGVNNGGQGPASTQVSVTP